MLIYNDSYSISDVIAFFFFFFNDTATTEISPLPLHDALPISSAPSTPTLAFSGLSGNAYYDGAGTFWFRPAAGGTVTVTAASSDSESGIGSYTFGTLNSNEIGRAHV